MELFGFTEEFVLFLRQWSFHTTSILFAGAVWFSIVAHLIITGHVTLGTNGDSDDIGCGDSRVYRLLVIFGGPAGLSFGLPYYSLMEWLGLSGWLWEYWIGFIYIQFATSLLQTVVFLLYALFGPRSKNIWRLFKSHLKGCGWISGLSPTGWIGYWLQQLLPNQVKSIIWIPRDIETLLVFGFNIFAFHTFLICFVGSLLNHRCIIPMITWINEDLNDDEDSSSRPQF